jgi:hypothetical protein
MGAARPAKPVAFLREVSFEVLKLSDINAVADDMRRRIGMRPTVSSYDDHDVLSAFGNDVLVASSERGDWLCKNLATAHWHQDDGVLHEHFFETVAALLKGEKACNVCP